MRSCSWQWDLRPGRFAVFYVEEDTIYARIDKVCSDDAEYLECRCYKEGCADAEVHEVHRTRFVYELSRAQFIAAWVNGWTGNPTRFRCLVAMSVGGTTC